LNEFKTVFQTEMVKSVGILKQFEDAIGNQDAVIAVNTSDVSLAHDRIDRRDKKSKKTVEDVEALEKKVRTLERQVRGTDVWICRTSLTSQLVRRPPGGR
jgi:hypothetical protein